MKVDGGKRNILLTNATKLNSHELAVLPSIINRLNFANNVLHVYRYAIAHPTVLLAKTAAPALLAAVPVLLFPLTDWILWKNVEESVELLIVNLAVFAFFSIQLTRDTVNMIWNGPSVVANGLESSITHTINSMPAEDRAHLSYALYDRVHARLPPLGFDDATNQRILASVPY